MFGKKQRETDSTEQLISFKNDLQKNNPLHAAPYSVYSIPWVDDLGVPINDEWLEAHILACPALDRTAGEYLDPDLIGIAGRRVAELKAMADGSGGHESLVVMSEAQEKPRIRELTRALDSILTELKNRYKKLKSVQESRI